MKKNWTTSPMCLKYNLKRPNNQIISHLIENLITKNWSKTRQILAT